jgi:acyl transferase domain-containing protein
MRRSSARWPRCSDRRRRRRVQWCALGSVKSQIGHTKAAAGAASLVKTVLALHHRTLPPTIKVERPNPAMKLDESPFYLNTTPRPWFHRADHPRRASVSSFGFGGSNFHVTMEEYNGTSAASRLDVSPVRLLLLSADDVAAMRAKVTALPEQVKTPLQITTFARESQRTFEPSAPVRLAMIVEAPTGVRAACEEAGALLTAGKDHARSTHCVLGLGAAATADSVAFLFPGQGSQYVGMGRDVALTFPDAFAAWEQAIAALPVEPGEPDLGEIVYPRPAFDREGLAAQETRLRATSAAQPALAATSLAQLAVLGRLGLKPAAAAGHSFGELVALHAAGVFDAATLVALARARGRAMEACASDGQDALGSMLAVAGDAATVRTILDQHGDPTLVLANDNHPRQAVLSGPVESLRKIEGRLTAAGLSFQPLKVAAAFHSPLVAPAAKQFGTDVRARKFGSARFPVIANATAEAYPSGAKAVQAQLADQLAQPVRFRESLDTLYARGCRVFVEVGAGSVLTGLAGKCLNGRPHVAIAMDGPGRHGLRSFWTAMADLAALGLPLAFQALHDVNGPWVAPAPPPTGPAVIAVGGANLGKPYPPAPGKGAPIIPAPAATATPAAITPAPVSVSSPVAPPPLAAVAKNAPPRDQRVMSESSLPTVPVVVRTPDMQSQILEAQRLTQQALLESFSMTLRGLGGAAANVAPASLQVTLPAQTMAPQMMVAAPMPVAAPAPMAVAPPAPRPVAAAPAPAPAPPPPAPVAVAPPPPAPVAAAPAVEEASSSTVLAIIAEKTGYPVDALAPDMDLEADLGIDSIKRVEILGAVNERVPGLDASKVSPADVRRISDLLALLGGSHADPQQAAAR